MYHWCGVYTITQSQQHNLYVCDRMAERVAAEATAQPTVASFDVFKLLKKEKTSHKHTHTHINTTNGNGMWNLRVTADVDVEHRRWIEVKGGKALLAK